MYDTIKKNLFFFALITLCQDVQGQKTYSDSYNLLKDCLEDKQVMKFKDAVYVTENAYLDGSLSKEVYDANIKLLKQLVNVASINYPVKYLQKDSSNIKIYASIFKVFSDTIGIRMKGENYLHYPFSYDFNDIFGSKDWRQGFISKIMETNKGNCHSMPYLYKILCEELNVPCYLALAPNHLYIKHRAEKGGWYNTELTSASFPIDAWLMASGYISLEAVQNGIYLDTLSAKENIALCVIDLAQGYNHKYAINDGKFVIECCDLALKYFPDYVNAMILKAETRLKQLEQIQEQYHYPSLKAAAETKEGKLLWKEMNNLYRQIHKLGYRQMPEKMYVEWLTLLKTEREKYSNKQFDGMNKK